MEQQKLSVSELIEDPSGKRGTNTYKQAAEKNRKSRKDGSVSKSGSNIQKPTLRTGNGKSASKEKYIEIESVPKIYLVERLPIAHMTTEEYIKEERKLKQYDSDEEFENFKDSNYVALNERYFSGLLVNSTSFCFYLGIVIALQYLYYVIFCGNYLVIYFWLGIIYSGLTIYTYYQISHLLRFANQRYQILMQDLNALITCVLSFILIWSFNAMINQADEINLETIKENRLYLLLPIYLGLVLNIFNYYINSVLGVYYSFQHKLGEE